jgi:hypothetical protein
MMRWFTLLALMCLLAISPAAMSQPPDANRFSQREKVELQDLLTAGLKVRTPSEKAFIAAVVQKVDDGELSDGLVKALFQRARKEHSRYPLPYFAVMIKQVAKKNGVTL